MTGRDLLQLAGRNLRESLLRNALTTLGIAVGVASLVAMLSLGVGLQQLATKRLATSGLFDSVVVFPRQTLSGFKRRGVEAPAPAAASNRVLDAAARRTIAALPQVREVYPDIRFVSEFRVAGDPAGPPRYTMVAGVPLSAASLEVYAGMQGRFFSGAEAKEAILQGALARELAPHPADLLGRAITLRYAARRGSAGAAQDAANEDPEADLSAAMGYAVVPAETTLRIVGIVDGEPDGALRGGGRARLFFPSPLAESLQVVQPTSYRDLQQAATLRPSYANLVVKVTDPVAVQPVEEAVKQMGFGAFSLLDASQSLRRFFAVLDLFLGIFGSLALAVASLGIVNTLVMAILERRRQIGIMKAIGAGDGDIQWLLFAEAGSMGFAGGVLGVGLGWLIGRAIDLGTRVYMERQGLPPEHLWTVPGWLVLGAIVFSVLLSLAAGVYPARRAARLDPVATLRYE